MLQPLSLYIHWPFCEKKCPYCDFNSHVFPLPLDQRSYKEALLQEMRYFRQRLGAKSIKTVFFGGGTPSLMAPEICYDILQAVGKFWSMDDDVEITLEANPSSAEMQNFYYYRDAGVNRISLGVQSLNDKNLNFLGRIHSAAEAKEAMAMAGEIFENVSFDLIYALPEQTESQWRQEIEQALALAKGHLSLYQLTIEKGTEFYKYYRSGQLTPLAEEKTLALYEMTEHLLEAAAMPAYEVSNFAQKGKESQHNLCYWRYQDYLGLGPGAHSRFLEGKNGIRQRTALSMEYHPQNWLRLVAKQGHAIKQEERLSPQMQGDEMLLMGLRLYEAFDINAYTACAQKSLKQTAIDQLVEEELIFFMEPHKIAVTKKGRRVLNHVILTLARS